MQAIVCKYRCYDYCYNMIIVISRFKQLNRIA